jgi:interferon-induced transmembrane protein
MYNVIGSQGDTYSAPDLATLQQWAWEMRLLPTTHIQIVESGKIVQASTIPGLQFPNNVWTQEQGSLPAPTFVDAQVIPPNLLPKAILATVFCFSPFGIAAIIYAVRAQTYAACGRPELARELVIKANRWANVTLIVGLPLQFAFVLLMNSLPK